MTRRWSHYEAALTIKRALNSPFTEAYTWNFVGHAASDSGDTAAALRAYQQSERLLQQLDFALTRVDTWAGLAEIFLRTGDLPQAQLYAEQVWDYIVTAGFEGEWQWVYSSLKLFTVFAASNDPRADEILRKVYQKLHERAARIKDAAIRDSLLRRVPENRRLLELYAARYGVLR